MKIIFITLFPEFIQAALGFSIMKRAVEKDLLQVEVINPRDFTQDKHRTVDDKPFGGGTGMLLKAEPFYLAIAAAKKQLPSARIIALVPAGEVFSQDKAAAMAGAEELIFLCGHYEGFDERIFAWVDEQLSIGDYVLTGGELPALVVVDAVARYLPGVLGKEESIVEESFHEGLLEYPQYTAPPEFQGLAVPEVLRGGNHRVIRNWRRREALQRTYSRRPDILARARLSREDRKLLLDILMTDGKETNG